MSSKRSPKDLKSHVRAAGARWEFGPFVVDEADGRLTCRGRNVTLTPKSFEVVVYLLRRHPRLVTPNELLDAAWPDCCVSGGALTSTIWMVRRALRRVARGSKSS